MTTQSPTVPERPGGVVDPPLERRLAQGTDTRRWRRWWVTPLAVYLATRVVGALMVVVAAPMRTVVIERVDGYHATVPSHSPPSFLDVLTSWDAQWYWSIVRDGYATSAVDAAGHPAQTNLAFFPLYPELVRLVSSVTGAGFAVTATTLSLVLGGCAVVGIYALVARAIDQRRALVCVLLLCCFASAPILQTAYTESLALFLVAAALLLLQRRSYLWCLVPTLLLGLTRAIVPVLLVVIVAHWVHRVRLARRSSADDQTRVPHLRLAVLALSAVAAIGLWPLLAAVHTRDPSAFLTTEAAWPGMTGSLVSPPWLHTATRYPAVALLFLLALVGLFQATLLLRGRRRWGVELTAWAVAYPAYILATTIPSFSLVRFLLLAFPLGLLWAPDTESPRQLRRQRVALVLLVTLGLLAQWLWVSKLLVYAGPHGGWGYP